MKPCRLCSESWKRRTRDYQRSISSSSPFLSSLSFLILCTRSTSDEPPVLPRLSNFNSFAYTTRRFPQGFITSLPDLFITLRSLNLEIQDGVIPAGIIAASNLTTLDLAGSFEDTVVFSEILMHGNRLEVLRLRGKLGRTCTPSIAFRGRTAPLPCLREFVFSLTSVSRDFEDSDLFGAITDFVRKHPALKALKLLIYPDVHHVGYDASVWGVLPTLTELRLLHIVIPQDLSPALSTWLIPRTVKYLSLSTSSIRNIGSMVVSSRPSSELIVPDLAGHSHYGRVCRKASSI